MWLGIILKWWRQTHQGKAHATLASWGCRPHFPCHHLKNKNGRRQTLAYANIPCFGKSRDEGDVKQFSNREQGMWGFTLAIMAIANSKEWASFRPPSLMIWFRLPYVKELGSTNILWVELTSHIAVHSRVGSEWYILQSYSLVGMCWKFMIRWGSLVREVSITSSVQAQLNSDFIFNIDEAPLGLHFPI